MAALNYGEPIEQIESVGVLADKILKDDDFVVIRGFDSLIEVLQAMNDRKEKVALAENGKDYLFTLYFKH